MGYAALLKELNKKQLAAVEAPRQPVLMLAGPGTGKTRTLIARIAYLIHKYEIPPEHILALTFSNKAVHEIKVRLDFFLKGESDKINASTIHAFCLDILRKYHEKAGLSKFFSVCDDTYQENLLKNILLDKVQNPDKAVKGIKNAFDHHLLSNKPLQPFSEIIYEKYIDHLTKHRLIDFNHILTYACRLLKENSDIKKQYNYLYQAILVDEFQDTDKIQYEIIKLVSGSNKNIFVVADDDQSIYAWRGANPENIRQFIKDFNIKKPFYLDINYRSGQNIVEAASILLNGLDRIEPDKELQTTGLITDNIHSVFFDHEEEEIRFLIEKIKFWQKEKNVPLNEIAIIYPRHSFGEKYALRMLAEKIPFQQASKKNLTDDPKIKKVLLYLKLIRDPLDDMILQEVLESELGYNLLKQIQKLQHSFSVSFRKALYTFTTRPEIGEDSRQKVNTFIGHVANLVNLKSFFRFSRLVEEILLTSRDLDHTFVEENLASLDDFEIELPGGKNFPHYNLIINSKDAQVKFISEKLIETAFDKPLSNKHHDLPEALKPNDLVFNFGPSAIKSTQAKQITLIQYFTEKRQSVFSVLARLIQQAFAPKNQMLDNYVIIDLETTSSDPETCEIVEIAAVRVRDNKIKDSYQTLVKPDHKQTAAAESVHKIKWEKLKNAPDIKKIWSELKNFLGNDLLIAHNGYTFDFRILDRYAKKIDGNKWRNVRYDSLVFLRNIYPAERHSLDALIERFNLETEKRHRALDDVIVLHKILLKVFNEIHKKSIKTSFEHLFEYAALGNFITDHITAPEDKVIFLAGVRKLLSPYSAIIKEFCEHFSIEAEHLKEQLRQKISEINPGLLFYNDSDDFYRQLLLLAAEFDRYPVDQATAEFLSFVTLVNPQDNLKQVEAVNLLTFHAAKGLEFRKVFISGLEDENMPSYFAYKNEEFDDRPQDKKLDEQKRLLYVGITRAKEEVILSAVKNRFGKQQKSSPFLRLIIKNKEMERQLIK